MAATAPPACHEDARRLIYAQGLSCFAIVAVDSDSILYLNAMERPRTLWLHRPMRGKLRVHMVPGFDALMPAGWHDQRPGEGA